LVRELQTAGLAVSGGCGALTYSYEASFSAAVAALLLVMGGAAHVR